MSKDKKNIKSSNIIENFKNAILFPLISVFVALFVAVLLVMWCKNINFIEAFKLLFTSIWQGSFGRKRTIIETFVCITPLLFVGLANAVAFRTGLFNIGVEGQFTMGMMVAAIVGVIPGIPAVIHIPLVLIAGMAAGAIWAGVPGYLKAKVGANEVVSTIMMNYVALNLCNYLIMGPLNAGGGSASTKDIQDSAQLWRFIKQSYRLNIGIFIGLAFIFLVYILLWKTTWGYELRAVGLNPHAAEYGGINIKRNIILAMVISGAIGGIGGAVHVSGIQHNALQLGGFTGYGFDGMTVALLGKNHPVGVLLASILFGALSNCSLTLQMAEIPKQIVYIIQGIIILFVAADYVYKWIGEKRKKEAVING